MTVPTATTIRGGGPLLVGLFALTVVAFAPTLLSFHNVWMRQPYTHGYLILAAIAWLVWRDRGRLAAVTPSWDVALPAAAVLSVVWLVAQVTSLQMVAQAVLPALLLLWAALVLGMRAAMLLAPVAALFLLAVPFWDLLTPILQWMTVFTTGVALAVLRVPATLDGNVVNIPSGTFLIEDGCAGLNYLLAGVVIGALYAYSFVPRWRTRIAVLGLSAAIAILGNWVRVTALVVIGHATEMQSGLMEGHLTFGWAIFLVGLLAFFPLAGVVERRGALRWPSPAAPALAVGAGGANRRALLRSALPASMVVAMGPLLYLVIGVLPRREVPPSNVLGSVDTGWVLRAGEPARGTSWQPVFPLPDEADSAIWTNGSASVLLDRLVYHGQSQDAELVGYGSRIAPDSAVVIERLFGQVGPERRLVNEAIVREGGGHRLVWYWYRVGGVETQSAARAKMLEVWAFIRRATTSELIALSTPCGPTDCADASRTLSSFLGST
ncbi:MAG: exosortase C-terminal domain/associated protein EpsI [Longimicrobiales bacterium]